MLSSQERHEQHLQRERTRAQKVLKMQETLHLTDSEVVDHAQFARQVPCKVHGSMAAWLHSACDSATVHAILRSRSIVRQVRCAHVHGCVQVHARARVCAGTHAAPVWSPHARWQVSARRPAYPYPYPYPYP